MKREILNIGWALAATAALSSCDSFLEESPKTFLSPKYYFQTENQITAGVNGLYTFVDDIFDGDIEVGTQNFIFLDYLPGYGIRPRAASTSRKRSTSPSPRRAPTSRTSGSPPISPSRTATA